MPIVVLTGLLMFTLPTLWLPLTTDHMIVQRSLFNVQIDMHAEQVSAKLLTEQVKAIL